MRMHTEVYETEREIGQYKITGIAFFHEGMNKTDISLMLEIDNSGFYCRVLEFTLEQRLSPASKLLLVEKLTEAYGMMLLPDMIMWKDKVRLIEEPEVENVVKLKSMEQYIKDAVFDIVKTSIPYLNIR